MKTCSSPGNWPSSLINMLLLSCLSFTKTFLTSLSMERNCRRQKQKPISTQLSQWLQQSCRWLHKQNVSAIEGGPAEQASTSVTCDRMFLQINLYFTFISTNNFVYFDLQLKFFLFNEDKIRGPNSKGKHLYKHPIHG